MIETARIVASYGKAYVLETSDGQRLIATTRSKKTDYACGDIVQIQVLNKEQAVINAFEPRKTLLYRSDQWRSKLIAANVTQIVIVVAPVPSWHRELLERCLIAARAAEIHPLICLNKCDLPEAIATRILLEYYADLGYELIEVSAQQDITPLRDCLSGHTSVLVGQSGMGKSTLTNAMVPNARAKTREISQALDSGKHTTTHAMLYHLDAQTDLIDSPGLQAFGLNHLRAEDLPGYFPEFMPHLGQCRFHNCRHRQEPGCHILEAVAAGDIPAHRLELLHRLQDELSTAAATY